MSDKMEDVAPSMGGSSFVYTGSSTPPSERLSPTFSAFAPSHPSTTPPLGLSSGGSSLSASSSPQHHSSSPTPPAGHLTNQQVTQLIEDLRHTELSVRLNSFRKVQVIAQALGVARTRGELLPYLAEFCDDDDEVLLILSSMLGEMVDAVGGSEHAAVLLQPLEQLAGSEETAVREKAVASLAKIMEQISESALLEHVMPLLRRCANADWFTSRISSATLFPILYPRLPSADEASRKELRAMYANLCKKEETPMVKRAAAANLGAFASVLDSRTLQSEFHPLLIKLSRDEIDSVRLLVVQSCVQIMRVYVKDAATRADSISKMKPIIISLSDDTSWRVRYMLADKFIELCATMVQTAPPAAASSFASAASAASPSPVPSSPSFSLLKDDDLINCFLKLLEDPELEVRTSATLKCGEFARLLGSAKTMEKFFFVNASGKPIQQPAGGKAQPPLKMIVADQTVGALHTKSALASVILQFSSVLAQPSATPGLSPNNLIIEHLLPLILSLLADEHAEVRLGLIAKLGEEGTAGGSGSPLTIDVLSSSLLPALAKLAADAKWRVRLQTIQLIPSLAAFFQQDLFHAKLFDTTLAWLGDSIWSIREAAIINLVRLTQLFGREWGAQKLLPKIKALGLDKSYVFRLTAVFAMKDLAQLLGPAVVSSDMLPMLVGSLSADPVPNVRFNVARLLGYLAKESLLQGPNAAQQVEKTLNAMKEDQDADVKYCAMQAIREGFPRNTQQQQGL